MILAVSIQGLIESLFNPPYIASKTSLCLSKQASNVPEMALLQLQGHLGMMDQEAQWPATLENAIREKAQTRQIQRRM